MIQEGIRLVVNGAAVVAGDPSMTLFQFLREGLGLISVRNGCAKGQCGACTVLVNGKATKACVFKMGKLEDARVGGGLGPGRYAAPAATGFYKTECLSMRLLHGRHADGGQGIAG